MTHGSNMAGFTFGRRALGEGGREGERERGRERGREGERERGRERGREGRTEGEKEGGREGQMKLKEKM